MAGDKKNERVTIRTVAADAGVSVAAVSKVLRDAYGVSASLRAKVVASVDRLGYRPSAVARGMRGQTYTLGVLLSDIRNPFFSDIMDGVNSALERTQYQALLGISRATVVNEAALVDSMIDRQIDGVILIAPRMSAAEVAVVARRLPTVLVGYHQPHATDFDTVNNDDQLGAMLVVRHLIGSGYRHITFLSLDLPGFGDVIVTGQRELGYTAAMKEGGLAKQTNIVRAEQTAREVRHTARQLLKGRHPPEAIFCWSDFVAFEVLSVATELGISVPDEIALVGYDNTTYCDLAQNDLTSVDQSGQSLGLQATRLLIERIKGREAGEQFVVTPRLVVRGSSRRAG